MLCSSVFLGVSFVLISECFVCNYRNNQGDVRVYLVSMQCMRMHTQLFLGAKGHILQVSLISLTALSGQLLQSYPVLGVPSCSLNRQSFTESFPRYILKCFQFITSFSKVRDLIFIPPPKKILLIKEIVWGREQLPKI